MARTCWLSRGVISWVLASSTVRLTALANRSFCSTDDAIPTNSRPVPITWPITLREAAELSYLKVTFMSKALKIKITRQVLHPEIQSHISYTFSHFFLYLLKSKLVQIVPGTLPSTTTCLDSIDYYRKSVHWQTEWPLGWSLWWDQNMRRGLSQVPHRT